METESQDDRDEEGDFHGMRISRGLTSAAENDERLGEGRKGGDPRETYLEQGYLGRKVDQVAATVLVVDSKAWAVVVCSCAWSTRLLRGNVNGKAVAVAVGWLWNTEGTPVSHVRITCSGLTDRSQRLLGRQRITSVLDF
jgi:hypothetical protein